MSLPEPSDHQRQRMLSNALSPLGKGPKVDRLFKILDHLFADSLNKAQFLNADAGNPVNHHPLVLKHAMEIARAELNENRFTWDDTQCIAVIALLHDICPTPKITTTDVDNATDQEREQLEAERQENRRLHMRLGAEYVLAKLILLNRQTTKSKNPFTQFDINIICNTIAKHDNLSLTPKCPIIPKNSRLLVIIREADRLWMVSPEGVRSDLLREQKKDPTIDPDNPATQLAKARSNTDKFKKERKIYHTKTDGPFCDKETFFRTPQAYMIFQRYLAYWDEVEAQLGQE